jgi:non-homologous end joining protein Ku
VVLVRPAEGGLVLQVLHYPELVKACPRGIPSHPEAASAELHLAGLLIDAEDTPGGTLVPGALCRL